MSFSKISTHNDENSSQVNYNWMIGSSKRGSFFLIFEGDLEESRGGMWVVGEGVDS